MIQFFKDIYNGFINSKTNRKVLYSSIILLYLIFFAILSVKVNVEVITPGGINATVSTSEFQSANLSVFIETTNKPGDIYTVGVYNHKRISLFQYLIGKASKDIDFQDYDPKTDLSAIEDYQLGKKSKDASIINAMIVAYNEAKKVDTRINLDYNYEGLLIALVQNYSKSDLKADDIITHVGEVEITSSNQFKEIIGNINNETHFEITVIRNNESKKINTRKVKIDNSYVLGITTMEWYNLNKDTAFPKFEIHNNYSSVGGSGGAMLTLAIYNSLIEEDVTNGKKIIGTGTITIDGKVGDIAGVSQKVVTAKLYNADVFFCNPQDYEEAKAKAKEIEANFNVVRVEKFSDIIDYLKGEA